MISALSGDKVTQIIENGRTLNWKLITHHEELDNAKKVSKYWETTNWKLRTGLSLVSDTEILDSAWVRVGLIKMEQAERSPPYLAQNGDKLKWQKEWFVLYTYRQTFISGS